MTAARKRTSQPALLPALALANAAETDAQLDEQPHHLAHLSPPLAAILAQASPAALAAIEAAAVAIVGASPMSDPPILPPAARACMRLIQSREAWEGATIDELARAIGDATGSTWSDDSIRSDIVPKLKAWGVENCPRLGYRLPRAARNLHITPGCPPDIARSPAA